MVVLVTTHYFSDVEPADISELSLLSIESRGFDLQMWVGSKVFSSRRLDLGTAQLLKVAPTLPVSGRFLDLGCGWGPLAVSMALESPAATVWAVDVNPRALDMTKRNAAINGAKNVQTFLAEDALLQEDHLEFDVIWSNPPVRIGKEQTRVLLGKWLSFLTPTGTAYLVTSKNLGADSLINWLNSQGFQSQKIASKKGYRIIEVHKI